MKNNKRLLQLFLSNNNKLCAILEEDKQHDQQKNVIIMIHELTFNIK